MSRGAQAGKTERIMRRDSWFSSESGGDKARCKKHFKCGELTGRGGTLQVRHGPGAAARRFAVAPRRSCSAHEGPAGASFGRLQVQV